MPLIRYELTGELYDDDEIRSFYDDDIVNLDVEASPRLALLGPVAARVQTASVFPHVTCLAGRDDAPSQLQQQLFGGGTGQRIGGGVGQSIGGAPAQLDHQLVGFPARMASMLPGAQASLFSSMALVPGLALRTPCSMSASVRTVNCRLLARSVRLRWLIATRRLTMWWPSRSRARRSMQGS